MIWNDVLSSFLSWAVTHILPGILDVKSIDNFLSWPRWKYRLYFQIKCKICITVLNMIFRNLLTKQNVIGIIGRIHVHTPLGNFCLVKWNTQVFVYKQGAWFISAGKSHWENPNKTKSAQEAYSVCVLIKCFGRGCFGWGCTCIS